MNTTMNQLANEAKTAVLAHVGNLNVVGHTDELVVNMLANDDNVVLCVVSKKKLDEHLWLVYLGDHSSHVVHYVKDNDYYDEEEMGG